MTIVGQAELDIRAVGASFSGDVQRVVKPGMYQAGTTMDQTAQRGRRAFGLMWGSFTQAANGALGPVTEMVDHVQGVANELHHGSLALRTAAVGAAGLGISTGIQLYGAQEQQARQQLEASLENTGHVWEEYSGKIEGAISAGHRMAVHNYETMDALNRLVLATRNPERAIQDYAVVLKIAAARHMSVTSAAAMLGSVYGGNTRMFRMFGMNIADGNKALAAAQTATKSHTDAVSKLKTARQDLADTEARIGAARQGQAATASQLASAEASLAAAQSAASTANFQHGSASPQAAAAAARVTAAEARLTELRGKGTSATKLTVSQQIELRKAHEKVAEAQKNVTKTANDLTVAHKAAAGATTDVQKHVDDLSQRLGGQYTAAVHNFRTEIHAFGVDLEDALGSAGAKYGPGLTALSTGVLAVGTLAQGGTALFSRFSAGGRAAVAMNKVFAETTAAEVSAINASTEAEVAVLQAQAIAADAEIATSAEAAAASTRAGWTAAAATVEAELAGMSAAGIASAEEVAAAWTTADAEIAAAGRGTAAKVGAADATMVASAEASATASAAAWRGALAGIATKYGPLLAALGLYEYGKHVLGPADRTVHTDKYGQVRRNDTNELVPGSKFSAPGGMVLTPNHKAAIDAQTPSPPPHPTAPGQRRIDMPGQPIRVIDGEGSPVVSELRAGRMDNLQQLHALRQLLVAVQDLPTKGRHHGRHHSAKFSSPSLTTIW